MIMDGGVEDSSCFLRFSHSVWFLRSMIMVVLKPEMADIEINVPAH